MTAEYKAWWSLALACADKPTEALRAASKAEEMTGRVEVTAVVEWTRATIASMHGKRSARALVGRAFRVFVADRQRRRLCCRISGPPTTPWDSFNQTRPASATSAASCSAQWIHDLPERSASRCEAPNSKSGRELAVEQRTRDTGSRRPGRDKPRDGTGALHQRDHGEGPPSSHLRKARRALEDRGCDQNARGRDLGDFDDTLERTRLAALSE